MGRHVRITEGRGVPRIAMAGLDTRRRRKEPLLRRRARPLCPCRVSCVLESWIFTSPTHVCMLGGRFDCARSIHVYCGAARAPRGQCSVHSGTPPPPAPERAAGARGASTLPFCLHSGPGSHSRANHAISHRVSTLTHAQLHTRQPSETTQSIREHACAPPGSATECRARSAHGLSDVEEEVRLAGAHRLWRRRRDGGVVTVEPRRVPGTERCGRRVKPRRNMGRDGGETGREGTPLKGRSRERVRRGGALGPEMG